MSFRAVFGVVALACAGCIGGSVDGGDANDSDAAPSGRQDGGQGGGGVNVIAPAGGGQSGAGGDDGGDPPDAGELPDGGGGVGAVDAGPSCPTECTSRPPTAPYCAAGTLGQVQSAGWACDDDGTCTEQWTTTVCPRADCRDGACGGQ